MIYFTSDLHFDELRKLHYETPFDTIEQKNNYIKTLWKQILNPNDIIFIAGDIGDYKCLQGLPGSIVLILGNHDRDFICLNKKNDLQAFSAYLKHINPNIKIADNFNYTGITIQNGKKPLDLLIIHEPYLRNWRYLKSLNDHMYLPTEKIPYFKN